MKYEEKYSADDLFDMFANQANPKDLIEQSESVMVKQLEELAPDMEDAYDVADSIKRTARSLINNA